MLPTSTNSSGKKLYEQPELWAGLYNSVMGIIITAVYVSFSFVKSYTKLIVDIPTKTGNTIHKIALAVDKVHDTVYNVAGKNLAVFDLLLLGVDSSDNITIELKFDNDNTRMYLTGSITLTGNIILDDTDSENIVSVPMASTLPFRITSKKDLNRLAGITSDTEKDMSFVSSQIAIDTNDIKTPSQLLVAIAKKKLELDENESNSNDGVPTEAKSSKK